MESGRNGIAPPFRVHIKNGWAVQLNSSNLTYAAPRLLIEAVAMYDRARTRANERGRAGDLGLGLEAVLQHRGKQYPGIRGPLRYWTRHAPREGNVHDQPVRPEKYRYNSGLLTDAIVYCTYLRMYHIHMLNLKGAGQTCDPSVSRHRAPLFM